MSELDIRYKKAHDAVLELFSVRSASASDVRDNLQTLVEEILMLVDSLEGITEAAEES